MASGSGAAAGVGGRALVELNDEQLRKLAKAVHAQELENIQRIRFKSELDRVMYLNSCREAHNSVESLLEEADKLKSLFGQDATRSSVAHDVYQYATTGIGVSLQFIRSYDTRRTFLSKLKAHSDAMIKQLRNLNPATDMQLAQRLAIEAGMYRKAMLDHAMKMQHFVPNLFIKWLKESGAKLENLVATQMNKLGLSGPFKNLRDIQKLQVYENIIEAMGRGKTVVTYAFEFLGALGVAVLVFTAAMMVWDAFTAVNPVEASVRNAVTALVAVAGLAITEVATTAVGAGFVLVGVEVASVVVTVIGAVVGFGICVLIGAAAGALLDLIFSSGSSKVDITEGLGRCRICPMPDGVQLANIIKHNYPN